MSRTIDGELFECHRVSPCSAALAALRKTDLAGGKFWNDKAPGDDDDEQNDEVREFALPTKAFSENERLLLDTLLTRLGSLAADSKWHSCSDLLAEL